MKPRTTKAETLRGLYVLTDRCLVPDFEQLLEKTEQAIRGGCTVVQYRDKSGESSRRKKEAEKLQLLCGEYQVPLIINDDISLAAEIGADGVHLGKEDAASELARKVLGETAIIGVSCYNSLERALRAQANNVDYIAFGSFFPSKIKPDAIIADIELLQQARHHIRIPIAAIGGITAENGARLIQAGADMLAVISAVLAQEDCESAARRFSALFDK